MVLSNNIKLAVFAGLITGLIVGTIDIIVRIIKLSFEWFELYQTLLINLIAFTIIFGIIGIFIQLIKKILKFKVNKEKLSIFYISTSIATLLLFYTEIITIKIILFPYTQFYILKTNKTFYFISIIIIIIVLIIYINFWIKGKKIFNKIFFDKEKIKKLIKDYLFIIIIFIILSFLLDLFLLNYTPKINSDINLEGYPNVLLIVIDTVRADHLPVYNYPINTAPNIKKLAENSVVFENAISPSSWTLPSHSSIFTGKYSSNNGVTKSHQLLDKKEITLAEILEEKGYNTAGFVGATYTKAIYGLGQGFATYDDRIDFFTYANSFNKLSIRYIISAVSLKFERYIFQYDTDRDSKEINKKVFKWLDKNKNQPFFMFINYFDAHSPYNLGQEFREQISNEIKQKNVKGYNNESLYYDAEIIYLDRHIGELLKKLEDLKIKNNTIIIITADHGEEFGEHEGYYHGYTLYEEVIHVPFIIYYPKEFNSQKIEKRVSIIDIFSTVLDLLKIKNVKNIDSTSLLPLIKNESSYNEKYVISELIQRSNIYHDETNQRAILFEDWKLIEVNPERGRYISGLFNLKSDPYEKENLYNINLKKRKFLEEPLNKITSKFNLLVNALNKKTHKLMPKSSVIVS